MTAPGAEPGLRAIVTGASRGIGRACVERLFAQGARVALVGRDAERLRELVAGRDGHAVLPFDLSRPEAAELVVDRAVHELGSLDAVVCAAGIAEYAPALELRPEALERQLQVNLKAPTVIAQRAAAHMVRHQGGAIVVIGSTLAEHPAPLTAAYAASKAALAAMVRGLALELAPHAVRVNAVAPGVVDTAMVRQRRSAEDDVAARLSALAALHPRGRLGLPADVAEAVWYLLRARFVTGTVMTVDGGLSLGSIESAPPDAVRH